MEEMPVLSEEPETNEAEVVEVPLEVLWTPYSPEDSRPFPIIFFWRFGKKIIFLSFCMGDLLRSPAVNLSGCDWKGQFWRMYWNL